MNASMADHLTGAEATVRMLETHGIAHVFGLCDDATLPLHDALAPVSERAA